MKCHNCQSEMNKILDNTFACAKCAYIAARYNLKTGKAEFVNADNPQSLPIIVNDCMWWNDRNLEYYYYPVLYNVSNAT